MEYKSEKNIEDMTRAEFNAVPSADWNQDIGVFNSLVIFPTRRLHESGYRTMYFIACKDNMPIFKLSGCSDVLHINGIGGYGSRSDRPFNYMELIKPIGWSLDCLKKSGLLRLFTHEDMTCGSALSSFEVFHKDKIRPK